MEILFSFPRLDDFLFVEKMLNNDEILLDALDIEGNHQYQLVNYHLHDFGKVSCLLDRNIVTDLVSLVRGTQVPADCSGKSLRVVAGLQAFFNAAEILSNPSIAYHEYMDTAGLSTADAEIALFRSADNLNANIYLDIALGLRTSVPQDTAPHFDPGELKKKEIPEKLKYFERNIVTIKKALIIKASGVSDYEVMLQLTDWLFDKYMLTSPAFFFLCLYLSNGRIRRMLKSHSLRDVRNATWDLCFLQQWHSLLKRDPQTRCLAATRDHAIKEIARLMFIRHDESERLQSAFRRMWGTKNHYGKDLLERIPQFQTRMDDPQRGIVGADSSYVEQLSRDVDAEYNALTAKC